MKQQTAVQWLEAELGKYIAYFEGDHKASIYSIYDLLKSFEKAKKMEKEQKIEDYRSGRIDQQSGRDSKAYHRTAEQYFTETYGKP